MRTRCWIRFSAAGGRGRRSDRQAGAGHVAARGGSGTGIPAWKKGYKSFRRSTCNRWAMSRTRRGGASWPSCPWPRRCPRVGAGSNPVHLPPRKRGVALVRLTASPATCLELALPVNPIRAAREAAGITQSDLSQALRISQPMLSRQEQPLRRLRPRTVARTLDAIRRIQENRSRPVIALKEVLTGYGDRLAESAARKPRDPIERRMLREAGDPVALREGEDALRRAGERPRPPKRKRT